MKRNIAGLFMAGLLGFWVLQTVEASSRKEADPPQEPEKKPAVLTVGALPVPYAEILNAAKPDLAALNIELRVVEFTDYEAPNSALLAGNLDANYFQHRPYLESNPVWKAALVPVFGVHIEPVGLYARSVKTAEDLKDGAVIAIPKGSDGRVRALQLLQSRGLIALNPKSGPKPALPDIADNPKNFKFQEIEEPQLLRSIEENAAAVMSGTFAAQAGFHPLKDALLTEGADSRYGIYVVVKKGNEQDPRIKTLQEVLCSQKIKEYLIDAWNGKVLAFF
ncbi:MAG: methionine ABC transporter substrate-binding protein [Spirochaetaceae bacterium]|jgi:D-methionine transport system substrate-binding protein|nr:methionine ABC transporter substrate-binding protein [Spirochaetaceae bacterium]